MSDSIGARLRQARELRHLTLPQVSETTKLRTHYLQALENDDYSAIPSAAQARGFLRLYAEFLELDVAELLPSAAPEPGPVVPTSPAASPAPAAPAASGFLDVLRRRLSRPQKDESKQAVPSSVVPSLNTESADEPPAPAASEAQTAPHPRPASTQAKKKRTRKISAPIEEPQPAAAEQIPAADVLAQPPAEPSPEIVQEAVLPTAQPQPGASRSWREVLRLRFMNLLPRRSSPAAESKPEPVPAPAEPPAPNETLGAGEFNPLPVQAPASDLSSAQIFVEIGQQLRARREMLSLTYEEIERHTHVRTAFLAALERGDLEALPSPVQTRGILVNYATFLDLDADAVLLRFADGLQTGHRERGAQKKSGRTRAPMTVHTTLPPLRAFIASDLVFGGGLAIMLLLFAVWGISRVLTVRSQSAPRVTPPSISQVLAGTALPTVAQQVTVIPAEDTPVVSSLLEASPTLDLATLDPNVNVQVDLTASERAYLRVMVDGKLAFEGRTEAGGTYSYQAKDQVEVVVGNAAALRIAYNGHDLGLMGNFGEVIDRLYTAEGIATPTSTPPPTRTPTPRVTATPTETPTRTPTATPKP